MLKSFIIPTGYGGYRLSNGSTTCSGRVELLHGGSWGTLCDYLWNFSAANDLCQHLDCGVALSIPDGQSFGKGNGSFWNGTFSCKKNGSYSRDCSVSVLDQSECPAGNDARVICSGEQWKGPKGEMKNCFFETDMDPKTRGYLYSQALYLACCRYFQELWLHFTLTTRLFTLYEVLFVPGKSTGRAAPQGTMSWVQMVRKYECIHQGIVRSIWTQRAQLDRTVRNSRGQELHQPHS